jgi:uncharacterized protein YbjT (DUF2867 family)
MNILVCGSSGSIGSAVANALRSRGHHVVEAARGLPDTCHSMPIDFMQPRPPERWAETLRDRRVDAVVNCVGILMEKRGQTFERIHAEGPAELFRGAALAGVRRVVQVSALGVGADPASLATPYLHTKLRADDALAASGVDWAVLRPSLVVGPRSQSAALFATLAGLPVIGLPGLGLQPVQPIHVFEVAEIAARLIERDTPVNDVFELGGAAPMSYRAMLGTYRSAQGLGPALWCPVPMPLMMLGAWLAERVPQRVFCRDTLHLLERSSVTRVNAAEALLGRAPSTLAQGLAVAPAPPLVGLNVELSAPVAMLLRASLAFMWIYTALISAVLQRESGVMELLARCGFEGTAGQVALWASCALNLGLGVTTLLRPAPLVYALQAAAVLGYTLTAAVNMPELTIDHCGPLVKNVPVFGVVMLLWLAHGRRAAGVEATRRRAARPKRTARAAPLSVSTWADRRA